MSNLYGFTIIGIIFNVERKVRLYIDREMRLVHYS